MISVYYGGDTFGIDQAIDKLLLEKEGAGFEIDRTHGTITSELINNLMSTSFFAKLRIFIVTDALSEIDPRLERPLIDALSSLTPDTEILFVEGKLPTKSPVIDFLKKKATLQEFKPPKEINVRDFIKEKVAEQGAEIAPLALERLILATGDNLWLINEEVKKLALFKRGSEEPIMASDVDLLVSFEFNKNIFALLDAIAAKNSKRSIELINTFLEAGENAIYILTMIEWHFRNIAMARFEEGITEFSFAKKAKINPYVAKKSLSMSRGFTKDEIRAMYRKMRWADLKLKSGGDPKQVLLRLVA